MLKLQITVSDGNGVLGSTELDLNGNSRPQPRQSGQEPEDKMTDAQRRYLFRLLADMGIEGDRARDTIKEQLNVRDVKDVTKNQASHLIERFKNDISRWRSQNNMSSMGGGNHGSSK